MRGGYLPEIACQPAHSEAQRLTSVGVGIYGLNDYRFAFFRFCHVCATKLNQRVIQGHFFYPLRSEVYYVLNVLVSA